METFTFGWFEKNEQWLRLSGVTFAVKAYMFSTFLAPSQCFSSLRLLCCPPKALRSINVSWSVGQGGSGSSVEKDGQSKKHGSHLLCCLVLEEKQQYYNVADVANVWRHKSYQFCSSLTTEKREQRDDDIRANIKAFHGGLTRFGRNS